METQEVINAVETALVQARLTASHGGLTAYQEMARDVRDLYLKGDPQDWDQCFNSRKDQWDWACDVTTNKIPRVSCLMVNENENGVFIPLWAEQDWTFFHIDTRKHSKLEEMLCKELAELLMRIYYWFDCTSCCDAIDSVKVTGFGVFIMVHSARTFHS